MKKLAYIIVAGLSLGLLAGIASAQAGNIRPSQINPCPTNGEVLSTVAGTTSCTAQSSLGFVQTAPSGSQAIAQGSSSLSIASTIVPLVLTNISTSTSGVGISGEEILFPNLATGAAGAIDIGTGTSITNYNTMSLQFQNLAASSTTNYFWLGIINNATANSGICGDGAGNFEIGSISAAMRCGTSGTTLTVNGTADITGSLTVPSIAGTATATFALGSSSVVGSGATTPICGTGFACDEISGTVEFNTGTGISADGTFLTITLGTARANNANCVVGFAGGPPILLQGIATGSVLMVNGASNLTSSTSYAISYICGGK